MPLPSPLQNDPDEERELRFVAVDDADARRQALADIVTAQSSDSLFAHLSRALGLYGIQSFAIYTLDASDAALAFSSGVASSLSGRGADKLTLRGNVFLETFLRGSAPILVPSTEHCDELERLGMTGAAAFIRMPARRGPMGYFALFGDVPDHLFEGSVMSEFLTLVSVFSATFYQHRAMESTRREHTRTLSRLQELQQGQDVLLFNDRNKILESLVQRGCGLLGGHAGMLWLRRAGGWRLDYALGDPSIDAVEEMESILERVFDASRPALINALSGEETWDFDVDAIHMASVFVYPLRTREQKIGCLAVFDATVSRDSIDILESTALVGATAIENWHNRQRSLNQQRLQDQLNVAAKAQQRLLPSKQTNMRGLSSAHFSHYCDETGGDYVDAIPSRDPSLCSFLVGDVSGHGLGAAMLMVDVRARIHTHLEARPIWSPEQVLHSVNQVLCRESTPEEFVTLFLCTVDTRSGTLRYASAGHEPPLLYRPRTQEWLTLGSTGLPLGMEEEAEYGLEKVRLEQGDIIVFATDGATEARNAEGKIFGTDTIKAIVESSPESSAEELLSLVVSRTLDHCERRAFIDDVTYLMLKIEDVVLTVRDEAPPLPGRRIYADFFPSTGPAKDQQLQAVRRALHTRFPEANLDGVLMSIEEALSNAVNHGNKLAKDKDVELAVWVSENKLAVVVGDLGSGFDPQRTIPDHVDEKSLGEEHGRGLLIMTSLMDDVIYWDNGRKVCLMKDIAKT